VSMGKRTFVFVVLALLVCLAVATSFAGYYHYMYNDLLGKMRTKTIRVNLAVNYGNGTTEWFNQTEARAGDTLLDITASVATVNFTTTAGGATIEAINGRRNSGNYWWYWWMWTSWGWIGGPVACDKYVVGDRETLYWYYQDTSIYPLEQPT